MQIHLSPIAKNSGGHSTVANSYSSIVGGCRNTVSRIYSAVLGGSGNTINAAYQYAGIFGQNVNAVANNTFHVNCLNACSTPDYTISGPFPIGTIFYLPIGSAIPANVAPLYIQCA